MFVYIDTDDQPATASKFGVSGIPDTRFLTNDGKQVHKFVGYGSVSQVLGEMEKARQMAGR